MREENNLNVSFSAGTFAMNANKIECGMKWKSYSANLQTTGARNNYIHIHRLMWPNQRTWKRWSEAMWKIHKDNHFVEHTHTYDVGYTQNWTESTERCSGEHIHRHFLHFYTFRANDVGWMVDAGASDDPPLVRCCHYVKYVHGNGVRIMFAYTAF